MGGRHIGIAKRRHRNTEHTRDLQFNMTYHFNDSPIETPADDRYGLTPFARVIAQSIRSLDSPVGTTIALNGPWGSGKSSAINLIRRELEETEETNDNSLVISEFKCWWFRGEEALTLAFLQNLHALLSDTLKDKVKDLVPKLGRSLLQAGPAIGAAVSLTSAGTFAPLASAAAAFTKRYFARGDTIERTFDKLAAVLKAEEHRRFLIIIDDIDRLSPEESLAIFRMVKSIGQLPNITYLLAFDRALADSTVKEYYPSEGPHFLEKIIQASFELPLALRTDLNRAILSSIEMTCGPQDEEAIQPILNMFHDVVAPYLTTPRHVIRFQNAISVTWPAIANEIRIADFIALETLRLYEPLLFQSIRSHRSMLCGVGESKSTDDSSTKARFTPFLFGVEDANIETAKLALQRLFPRLEKSGYSNDFHAKWRAERRVCVEAHFDTYFRLSLSTKTLSVVRTEELIARADDREFIQHVFREAAQVKRNSGTSMVPVVLDELNSHAPRVDKADVEPLLAALFEIHDEIDLDIDKERGAMVYGDTSLRFHWLIRRLTNQRFTIDERTSLYMSTTQHSALAWLVDFVSSAKDDYRERDGGPKREEDCLTRKDVIDELVDRALSAIRAAAVDGSLLQHEDLLYILYRWRDFRDNDPTEVRNWTDSLLGKDDALVILAKKLVGESLSYSIGWSGLGDRVPKRAVRLQIDDNTDILDVAGLLKALRHLKAGGALDDESQTIVDSFIDAWQRRGESHDA